MLLGGDRRGRGWSLIPGVMRVRFGAPEIIVSLLLNYVALRIDDFLVFSYWKDPNGRGFPGHRDLQRGLLAAARWPTSNVHLGLVFGLLAVAGVWVLLRAHRLGPGDRPGRPGPARGHLPGPERQSRHPARVGR